MFGTGFVFKKFVEMLANSDFFLNSQRFKKKKKTKFMVICIAFISKICSITAISKCDDKTGQS